MAKFGFFADFLQGAEPAKLHDAVVARRKKLEKKHGELMVFAPALAAVASIWEEQHVGCRREASREAQHVAGARPAGMRFP